MTQVDIPHDRYYNYIELTHHVQALAAAFPHLCKLSSIGKTFQGREIWLLTITNSATGADTDKPAYYIDAHIHAEEHATSATALYAAWYLLHRYGSDPKVTILLDEQAFYIFPRLNPDGAAGAATDASWPVPRMSAPRASTRPTSTMTVTLFRCAYPTRRVSGRSAAKTLG